MNLFRTLNRSLCQRNADSETESQSDETIPEPTSEETVPETESESVSEEDSLQCLKRMPHRRQLGALI